MIKIILRGEEWGTRYGCTKERRLRVSIVCDDMLNNSTGTLCRQLDKAITGSVIRTRRLSPNCHLVGISSKLTDLIIQRLPQVRKEGNHKALTWRCIHWRANCWSSSFELNVLSRQAKYCTYRVLRSECLCHESSGHWGIRRHPTDIVWPRR